jgi:hypothetical protein
MRRAIARSERQHEPGDKVVLSAAPEFFDAVFFDWNLPESRKQVDNSPNFHMANLLYHISNVWDGKATSLRALIESAEVDNEAEFVTPRFGYRKARRSPRRMHGFG